MKLAEKKLAVNHERGHTLRKRHLEDGFRVDIGCYNVIIINSEVTGFKRRATKR